MVVKSSGAIADSVMQDLIWAKVLGGWVIMDVEVALFGRTATVEEPFGATFA